HHRAERGARDRAAGGRQHRRSAHPGGLALSLRRGEPGPVVRPEPGAGLSPGRPGRHGRAVRAGPVAHRRPGRLRRRARRARVPGRRDGAAGREEAMKTIDRAAYAEMYGPTTGDRVRLGDTGLLIEVERDHTVYGEE